MFKGIDVSNYQKTVDFNKVKASGIDFVIIKAGQSNFVDSFFERNYAGAKAAGLHVGAYWYSCALSAEDAKNEAECCIAALSGKQFDYPIYIDIERQEQFNAGKAVCSEIVSTFCNTLEDAGYFAGLYISRCPLQTHITNEVVKRYALWIAEYGSKCNYSGSYGIWQYSGSGACPGISDKVDLDFGYIDYPSIIISGGFNGYGQSASEIPAIPEVKEYKTGDKITLKSAPLFVSAYAARQSNVISGDYYIQSDTVICERIRVTTSAGNPDVTGWINVSDISDTAETAESLAFKVGDTVRLRDGAKDYNGKGLASFVYHRDHVITEIRGDRAVIAYGGTVIAAVRTGDLSVVG